MQQIRNEFKQLVRLGFHRNDIYDTLKEKFPDIKELTIKKIMKEGGGETRLAEKIMRSKLFEAM